MEVLIALAVVLGLASVMAWTEHRYRCVRLQLDVNQRMASAGDRNARDAVVRVGDQIIAHAVSISAGELRNLSARLEELHDRANENVIAALQAVRPGTVIRYTPLRPDAAPVPSPVTVEREAALRRPIIRNDAEQLAAESMSRAHHARDLEPA